MTGALLAIARETASSIVSDPPDAARGRADVLPPEFFAFAAPGADEVARVAAAGMLASDRLSELADGRLALSLRKPLRDGSTHLVFEPHELLEKLSAMVPAPARPGRIKHSSMGSSPPPRSCDGRSCPRRPRRRSPTPRLTRPARPRS